MRSPLASQRAEAGYRREIGRLTHVGVELFGDTLPLIIDKFAPRVPGRTTRVTAEARRWALMEEASETVREAVSAATDRSGAAFMPPR